VTAGSWGQVALTLALAHSLAPLPAQKLPAFPGLPRKSSAASYSPDGRTIYLFGGLELNESGRSQLGNDLWAFGRESNTWRYLATPVTPAARAAHGLVFDPSSGELKLLGGNANRCLDTLWSYSPEPGQWSGSPTIGVGNQFSSLLVDHTGTLWSVFGRCGAELFRGIASNPSGSTEWTLFPNEAPQPIERWAGVAAIDSRRGKLIVYGGIPPAGSNPDRPTIEVWAHSKENVGWEKLSHAGVGLRQERSFAAGAYSLASDALIVYGGVQTGTLNPDWYSPAGETFADLAVFDLQKNSWSTIAVDERVGPRAQAASSYCGCTGKLLVAGGVDTSFPPAAPPVASFDEIQIEKHGVFRVVGNRSNSRIMVGFLEVPDATGALEDIRLIDCARGEVLHSLTDAHPVGGGRYLLKFDPHALAGSTARIVGRIDGEPLGFIATIENETLTSTSGPRVDPGRVRTISLSGTRFEVEGAPGSPIRVEWFDIRGRLLSQKIYEATVEHIDTPSLATGVYFARMSGGSTPVVRRVFIRGISR
jgi:hypothetical protein